MKNSREVELKYFECLPIRLQEILTKKGMTQKDLSGLSGVSEQTISGWMRGTKVPRFAALVDVCNALECSFDYLTGHDTCTTHELQGVKKYTGLSEDAIRKLKNFSPHFQSLLSAIICDNSIVSLLDQFMRSDDIALERWWYHLEPNGGMSYEQEVLPVQFSDLSINGVPVDNELYRQAIMNLLRDALLKLKVPHYLPPDWRSNDDDEPLSI